MSETLQNSEPEITIDLDMAADWMRKYMTQKRVCDVENGVLRNLVKQAKSDGMDTQEMIATCVAARMDPAVAIQKLRTRIAYHVAKSIVKTDEAETLVEGISDLRQTSVRAEDLFAAEEAGFRVGRRGGSIDDNPYHNGTEEFAKWREWWGKGKSAMTRENPPGRAPVAGRKGPRKQRGARQATMPGMEPPVRKRQAVRKKAAGRKRA